MASKTSVRGDSLGAPPAPPALAARKWPGGHWPLADPLSRNGYALIANSGATGALGLVYWLLMARLYPAVDVGRASAAYAAMNLLAGVTALNFNGALTRFIPQAGQQTRTLVVRAYAVSALASVGVTIPFLLTINWWGPSYSELGGLITGVAFTGCVVAWAIFTLQDSVLVGLRSAFWVLVENGVFGVVKFVLLVLLVTVLPGHLGIYVSWMLPVFIAVPLVNVLIFGRLVPRHTLLTSDFAPPTRRQIGRFLAGDYAGALCLLATGSLIPVVVAARLDIRSTAYFYMAWIIAAIVDMIGINMGMSLTVEGAFDAATLAVNSRKALRKMALLLLPAAGLVALLAPWGLRLFGPAYAAHGAPVLELLAIATLPRGVTELYLGALRAQSRATLVALIQAARCVLMLGLTVAATGAIGTIGAGVAVVASQAAMAAAVSVGLCRVLTGDRERKAPVAPKFRAPVAWHSVVWPSVVRDSVVRDSVVRDSVVRDSVVRDSVAARARAWAPAGLAAAGFALFFACLRGVDVSRMNGLGLLSVLPAGAIAGVIVLALAFMLGLARPRAHPVALGAALAGLVICLDGVTAFIEPEPRFPTAYQIAGFVDYISRTGHTAPGLAAYFSWPGFLALVSFLTGAAGTHGLLTLMRVWPMAIDLLCLPPLFLITRNLRISWRAQWLAGFLFAVGNWVGQDYFSPQAFSYLLYLVLVAILVNWFTPAGVGEAPHVLPPPRLARLARLHRRIFGPVRPGEMPPRPVSTGPKAFLLALLIAIFTVTTASHQLTPFFMIGACTVLVLVRRCTLTGLPILFGVILAGWISFAAVDYWSGHTSSVFGGLGQLGSNVTNSVGGRLAGASPTHLLALHARVGVAAVVVGLAGLGLLRRRRRGIDDRVLVALLGMPVIMIGLQGYGGEMALRIYLFMLPAACVLAAYCFFPGPRAGRPAWPTAAILAVCAIVLPVAFFLARYGNEAFEQIPPGELAAANWVYAHDAPGVRLLWLSPAPVIANTPEMPWAYADLSQVDYVPELAPRDPASVGGLVSALRRAGPGSFLIMTQTQVAALQQTASYPSGWQQRFNTAMTAAPGIQVALANRSAVIYTRHWPPSSRRPPAAHPAGAAHPASTWNVAGVIAAWLLMALLAAREFIRVGRGAARLTRPLTLASLPLLVLVASVVVVRFVTLS
jgi:O-antigen/teichoic acid export membrane protein